MTLFDLIKNSLFTHKFVLQKIVCHLTGWERDTLIARYDDEISSELLHEIEKLYNLYAVDHEPLEYILGYVEYGGLRFHVNKHTIIPRPETEYMIESVREYLESDKGEVGCVEGEKLITLVDVGTGSGVLGLSILHSHGKFFDKVFLIDISDNALVVAKKNYNYLVEEEKIEKEIEVVIEKGNLFTSPGLDLYLHSDRFLSTQKGQKEVIVLANLPYIPDETFDTNPDLSIKYEPRVAFVGGDDGLDLYRIMFDQIKQQISPTVFIKEEHATITMFLEMMTWQVDILRKEFEWLVFEEIKTFHFQIRIVKVTLNN